MISQPTYLPWLGYFRIMKEADVYVILDNVQFEPRSWQCRNRIKSPGKLLWLSVPTRREGMQSRICDVEIDNSKPWRRQHWASILTSYKRSPYFSEYSSFFSSVYERSWNRIGSLNMHIIKYLASQLGLRTTFVQASKLELEGKRTNLLLEICKLFGADRYVSSIGAKEYMKADGAKALFENAGIKIEFLEFKHLPYKQRFGDFVPELSFIDCLFNCGPESSSVVFNEESATFQSID